MIKTTLIPANAVNFVTIINDSLVTNFKQGTDAEVTLPDLVKRALLLHYESGIVPVTETLNAF
jgi:hypothetical protein